MSVKRSFTASVTTLTFLLGLWIAFPTAPLTAQKTQGPITPKPGNTVQQPPTDTIRVRVALVTLPVTVRDADDELVLDLQKKDFHVLDNGVEQAVDTFDLGGEPLSAVLLF